jgi:hypothetical protein
MRFMLVGPGGFVDRFLTIETHQVVRVCQGCRGAGWIPEGRLDVNAEGAKVRVRLFPYGRMRLCGTCLGWAFLVGGEAGDPHVTQDDVQRGKAVRI